MQPTPDRQSSDPPRLRTELTEHITKAMRWIVGSGLQTHGDHDDAGAFHAWYDARDRRYAYFYAEITGYMLTLLGAEHPHEARVASDWLQRRMATARGSYRCLITDEAQFAGKADREYAFDAGVILNGLCELHRTTGRQEDLEAARHAATWLVESAQLPDGGFRPYFDARRGQFCSDPSGWSTIPGAFQCKIAIGLLHFVERSGDLSFARAARRLCEFTLSFQQLDGRLLTLDEGTNAHPHCYGAEGLWVGGTVLDEPRFLDASARATTWLLERVDPLGRVPRLTHGETQNHRTRVDALAQTLRLGVLHRAAGRVSPEHDATLHRIMRALLAHASHHEDVRAFGGFQFGRQSDGTKAPHVNSWVTAFAVQALQLYRGFLDNGECRLAPFQLV